MPDQVPAGAFIGQKVHVQDTAAAAWAEHRCLLKESVFLHDVKRSALKPLRQKIFDEVCAIRWGKPSAQTLVNWPEKLLDPLHADRLSESSSKPRRGLASPMPTRSPRIS